MPSITQHARQIRLDAEAIRDDWQSDEVIFTTADVLRLAARIAQHAQAIEDHSESVRKQVTQAIGLIGRTD